MKASHFQFSLVHEGWRIHWLEGKISTTSIGQEEKAQGEVMESLGIFFFFVSCVFFLERGGEWVVRRQLVVMCEEMLFMEENVCKQKNMEGSCV